MKDDLHEGEQDELVEGTTAPAPTKRTAKPRGGKAPKRGGSKKPSRARMAPPPPKPRCTVCDAECWNREDLLIEVSGGGQICSDCSRDRAKYAEMAAIRLVELYAPTEGARVAVAWADALIWQLAKPVLLPAQIAEVQRPQTRERCPECKVVGTNHRGFCSHREAARG